MRRRLFSLSSSACILVFSSAAFAQPKGAATLPKVSIDLHKLVAGPPVVIRSPAGVAKSKSLVETLSRESSVAASLRGTTDPSRSAANRMAPGAKASALLQPGIHNVNGKTTGFLVTPGGYLTISGFGFGEGMGEVNVIGQFPTGAAPFRVVDWHNGEIYAFLPAGLRGIVDHDVILQVVTRDGKTFKLTGGRFVATREEISITNGIARLVRVVQSGNPPAGVGTGFNDGYVYRETHGEHINCFAPGQDVLAMLNPGRGFEVTGFSVVYGRSDSGDGDGFGDAGSHVFTPGYALGDWYRDFRWGDCIKMNWGVWRSHASPSYGSSSRDWCQSTYQISVVTVSGPAGVSPF